MPKTVDNYIIGKFLFKDTFRSKNIFIEVQYYSCQHKILKKDFTLKKIDRPSQTENSNLLPQNNLKISYACSCFENQSNFLLNFKVMVARQLKSERVIKCLKILKSRNSIFAIYDQHPQKTLKKVLSSEYLTTERSKKFLNEEQIILNEIVKFVLELHDNNIAVGNINPDQIFLTSDNKIRISNFLIARKIQKNQSIQVDTIFLDPNSRYLAPELIKEGILSTAADIFSIGKIIKSLKSQKSQTQLSNSSKSFSEDISDLLNKMVDQNPQNRPSIIKLAKSLILNKSRNRQIGSDQQKKIVQKLNDGKQEMFENWKSNVSLRAFPDIGKPPNLAVNESRRTLLLRRNNTLNEDLGLSERRVLMKSRSIIQVDVYHRKFNKDLLEVPSNRTSRQINSPLSAKSIVSSTETVDSKKILTKKQKVQEIILLRNLVSFLLQMSQFVYGENKSKQLANYFIQEALSHTQIIIKSIQKIIDEQKDLSNCFKQMLHDCRMENKKVLQISRFFSQGSQFKKQDQFLYCQELKKFAKYTLSCYSGDFNFISGNSQLSDSLRKSNLRTTPQKLKVKEDKLFKTLLILKKLEFGSYYEFFKAKIHHFNKKFWFEHYFEFERSFDGKYFVIQIKDLINRK